ncbi:MBL fold metallo-hydrolase [Aquabacterium sp.]|uniref:MBL fold metallo-hydrolase n=1 Tax=Aquabacterium sp. TaxID=1872578 RepID=UPI002BA0D794|nr:MBL fold metallo-hydrolase [Aquabacterium sp.]HSW07266.1 MBL fold metallo-hydrolase [Aquabacterium sp.]
MQRPTMFGSRRVAPDTIALRSYAPLPGFGIVPVHAHVIRARQPVLVDTGIAALQHEFMRELRSVIDPAALRWIWLTHLDADHVGNLRAVLAEAPQARVVTNYLGMGKMDLQQLPLDRVYLLNPGQTLDAGDRHLVALQPPCYDAPETMGLFDARTRTLFSADCFGALMADPAERAQDMSAAALREGIVGWAAIDAPWLRRMPASYLATGFGMLRDFAPEVVLGSHLPPATGMLDTLFQHLVDAREALPFVGPDQAMMERMRGLKKAA